MTAAHRALLSKFDVARYQVEQCGGVASTQQLADRWKVSRPRVFQLRSRPDFPRPIPGTRLYLVQECDEWRARRAQNLWP